MLRAYGVVIGLCGLSTAAGAAPPAIEAQVIEAINQVRARPAAMIDDLHRYRGLFHANLVMLSPGPNLMTSEGVRPVDEAIGWLEHRAGAAPLAASAALGEAAADHIGDQGRSGAIGHAGADGLSPGERMIRRGGGEMVSELISYGARDAADVVRQLVVDDGVRDRGHRRVLFSAGLRYVGVACGPHPRFRTMCVIDLAETPDGRDAETPPLDLAAR